jgi:hypothetical protein
MEMKLVRFLNAFLSLVILSSAALAAAPTAEESLDVLNQRGVAAQRKRCLGEASAFYTQVLKRDIPAEPTEQQKALVLKFAPRLANVAGEFFGLKDIVAIVHPDKPVIGYHLFWDDDIAYPADNEPCDHEIVWIEYDPESLRVTRVSTYFHGKILSPPEAVEDANAHGGRAFIGVEWGFHGSVPLGGFPAAEPTLRRHWELAHLHAREFPRSPLARGWPTEYPGDFNAYSKFEVERDPRPVLEKNGLSYISRWPTATLDRYCLRYNFAAKPEWPWTPVEPPSAP